MCACCTVPKRQIQIQIQYELHIYRYVMRQIVIDVQYGLCCGVAVSLKRIMICERRDVT
jgi:hypothetical protein